MTKLGHGANKSNGREPLAELIKRTGGAGVVRRLRLRELGAPESITSVETQARHEAEERAYERARLNAIRTRARRAAEKLLLALTELAAAERSRPVHPDRAFLEMLAQVRGRTETSPPNRAEAADVRDRHQFGLTLAKPDVVLKMLPYLIATLQIRISGVRRSRGGQTTDPVRRTVVETLGNAGLRPAHVAEILRAMGLERMGLDGNGNTAATRVRWDLERQRKRKKHQSE